MTQILALMLLGLAGVAGHAAARTLLPHARRDRLGLWATTLALAVGALTQVMLWVALLLPGKLGPDSALVGLLVLVAAGALALRRRGPAASPEPSGGTPTARTTRALAVAALAVSVAILLGAVLWPLSDGDALEVYGPLGRTIAATGGLPFGERLYEAYPMLVPMLFTAIEWLCGGPNEYLSRLVVAALAVAAMAAAGWLARELSSVRAGWFTAALLASCPVYCRWATSAYADIPAGFFVVLAAVFAWRWWRGRRLADALLGGAAAGFALWTKNSTMTLLATAPMLVAAWWWAERARPRQCPAAEADCAAAGTPWRWSHLAAAAATAVAVAAPFYVRNLVVFGFAVPATAWSERARHDLAGLVDPLLPGRGFGLVGWLAAAAVVVCLGRLVARRGAAAADALLLSIVVPYVGAWWWWASYDPRFLVTVLPLGAAFAGWQLDLAVVHIERTRPRRARWAAGLSVTCLLLGTPMALRRAVEHKRALVADPLMGDLERHRLQVGGLFELGGAIDRLPSGARVAGVPEAARFYLGHDRLRLVAWAYPGEDPCSTGFDYRVLGPLPPASPVRPSCLAETVFRTSDGYELVRTATARGAGEVGE